MNRRRGRIVGCVLAAGSQPNTDWDQWQLPIVSEYCQFKDPYAGRFEPTEKTIRLQRAGFLPIALVASHLYGRPDLGLVILLETPQTVRDYLLRQEREILHNANELEKLRRS